MPFAYFTSETLCLGLKNCISFLISWKDAETGRQWIWPTFVRTNYGRWSTRKS